MLFSPLIPCLYSFFEKINLFLIRPTTVLLFLCLSLDEHAPSSIEVSLLAHRFSFQYIDGSKRSIAYLVSGHRSIDNVLTEETA